LHLFGGGGCVAESYDSPFRGNGAAVGEGSRLGQVAVVSLHLFSSQHRRWEKRYSLRSGASMNLTAGRLRSAQVSICMEQRASASLRCGTSSCARLSKIEFGSGPWLRSSPRPRSSRVRVREAPWPYHGTESIGARYPGSLGSLSKSVRSTHLPDQRLCRESSSWVCRRRSVALLRPTDASERGARRGFPAVDHSTGLQ
jgi:hypothetical protein